MATAGERWAFWLETQLETRNWRHADLVRASGTKANGRPVIDAPRVGAWVKGQRPSFELASAAGEALGVGAAAALAAAGYTTDQPDSPADHSVGPQTQDRTRTLTLVPGEDPKVEEDNEVLAAIRRDPDLDEASRAHFMNQYVLLSKLSRLSRQGDDRGLLPYVAHGQRTEPVDVEEERRLEELARQAARENPDSPYRDK